MDNLNIYQRNYFIYLLYRMPEIQITPVVDTRTKTISKVVIKNVVVTLHTTASCFVEIYYVENGQDQLFDAQFVSLTQEQYDNWLMDDAFFEDCILTNLGYTRSTQ